MGPRTFPRSGHVGSIYVAPLYFPPAREDASTSPECRWLHGRHHGDRGADHRVGAGDHRRYHDRPPRRRAEQAGVGAAEAPGRLALDVRSYGLSLVSVDAALPAADTGR